MERPRQSLLLVALVLAFALSAAGARADPSDETEGAKGTEPDPASQKTSQDLFWEGTREYGAGNYQRAAELFERVYAEVPESEVVFNIALARAKNGQCGQAKARFAEYSAQVSDVAVREQATAKFSEVIESCVESRSQGESGTRVPAPGESSITQTESSITQVPSSLAAPPAAVAATTSSGKHVIGWVLVGAAAGAASAAIYFETERRAASSGAAEAQSRAEYEEFQSDFERARLAGLVSASVAVGLAGLGVTLLVLDAQSGESSVTVGLGTDRAQGNSLRLAAVNRGVRFSVSF